MIRPTGFEGNRILSNFLLVKKVLGVVYIIKFMRDIIKIPLGIDKKKSLRMISLSWFSSCINSLLLFSIL